MVRFVVLHQFGVDEVSFSQYFFFSISQNHAPPSPWILRIMIPTQVVLRLFYL